MTSTATLIRKLDGFRGDARLYKVDPPHEGNDFLIVSAVVVDFGFGGGPETYIFPATADGEIADWGELDGSYKGGLDHATALVNAGYAVV